MKTFHLIFASTAVLLTMLACSKDDVKEQKNDEEEVNKNAGEEQNPEAYITLSEAELEFCRTGGEATVTVDTNYDWDYECSSDWFTTTKGDNSLTVTCCANETVEVREGAVIVFAGDGAENIAESTLTITQLSKFDPDALVLEYTFTSEGTTIQLALSEKNENVNGYAIDCTVDWGDGSPVEKVTASWPSHTYYNKGVFDVTIDGTVECLCAWDYDKWNSIDGVDCLTAVKQWGDTGLKSMDSAFNDCTNLTSLPEEAGPFSNVTTFQYTFNECASLTAIPENIFSNCTAAESFYATFYNCSSLTSIPETLFSNCTKVTDFQFTFYGCSALISIPETLFINCPAVESFFATFYCCKSLTSVPETLFHSCTAVKNFNYTFYGCENLTSFPETLFYNCTTAKSFNYMCYYCPSLTSVPESLFSKCTMATDFQGTFCYCFSLKSVPINLFDNNPLATDFALTFFECLSVEGESPYTEIDGRKIHLYERKDYPHYFTAPENYIMCFMYSSFDDINDIPSSWGGNNTSGNSANNYAPAKLNTNLVEARAARFKPQKSR